MRSYSSLQQLDLLIFFIFWPVKTVIQTFMLDGLHAHLNLLNYTVGLLAVDWHSQGAWVHSRASLQILSVKLRVLTQNMNLDCVTTSRLLHWRKIVLRYIARTVLRLPC